VTSTVVVGASRGLGRGIALALARAGRPTVAVARSSRALLELAQEVEGITPEVADARSPEVAQRLLDTYQPAAGGRGGLRGPQRSHRPGIPGAARGATHPAAAGSAVLDLLTADRSRLAAEYLLDGEGLHPLPS
jgi:NAD(P)-dependent dehydrogenase (short-subunit alcohol dehydrogenase family)